MKKLFLFALLVSVPVFPAILVSRVNGNMMTVGTWQVAETGAGSQQLTINTAQDTAIAYSDSTAFTCTILDNITGLLVHGLQKTVTGTVTVGLSDDNGATHAREVTVNATDLPTSRSWIFFTFGSSLACDGVAHYKVGIVASDAGNATFYTDGTAGNWGHVLATDAAPGAVAAADILYVVGDHTGAGVVNTYTVTMNDIASTDFGAITVGDRGVFSSGLVAATAYTLKISGDLTVWGSGTLNFGAAGFSMPASSSLDVLFDSTVNVEFGLIVKDGGIWNADGNHIAFDRTFLDANAAVNDVTLTTADSTGWKSGDLIVVAATIRPNPRTSEQGDLNGDAAGTTLTVHGFAGVGGGLAFAHDGIAPLRGEIVNLSRNVKIHGVDGTHGCYILLDNTATVVVKYTEVYYCGSNTAPKYGFAMRTTTGSANIQYTSIHDGSTDSWGFYVIVGAGVNNFTLAYDMVWKPQQSGVIVDAAITDSNWSISNTIVIYGPRYCFELNGANGTLDHLTAIDSGNAGFYMNHSAVVTMTNLISHSNAQQGIFWNNGRSGSSITTGAIWRNNSYGWMSNARLSGHTYTSLVMFGNSSANFYNTLGVFDFTFIGLVSNGDTTFATGAGINNGSDLVNLRLVNCDFSTVAGIKTAHNANQDIALTGYYVSILSSYSLFGAGLPTAPAFAGTTSGSYLGLSNYNQVAGDHRMLRQNGTTTVDTVTFKVTPAEHTVPNITYAGDRYRSAPKVAGIKNGDTVALGVWVYKSALYNGAQPRLIVRANGGIGISLDAVLDTFAGGLGVWEQLIGNVTAAGDDGVLEAYVDFTGTAGYVTVDSWTAAGSSDQSGQAYWLYGIPGPGVTPIGAFGGGGSSSGAVH